MARGIMPQARPQPSGPHWAAEVVFDRIGRRCTASEYARALTAPKAAHTAVCGPSIKDSAE
eukprot:9341386-Pyramimonas_sp.AAC.1